MFSNKHTNLVTDVYRINVSLHLQVIECQLVAYNNATPLVDLHVYSTFDSGCQCKDSLSVC